MLPCDAIRVRRTFDTAVVLDPTPGLASSRTILVVIAFDADHPFRCTNLPPNSTARIALGERDGVYYTRSTAGRAGHVESKLRIAAEQEDSCEY